jgi:hypothetical protein
VARENGTYFVNPNHPETTDGTGSCQLTILKLHPEICQIRLDFEQFALAGERHALLKLNFGHPVYDEACRKLKIVITFSLSLSLRSGHSKSHL